jgi:pyruvate dehydrogenase E2 component (dihydrolipoamide acetyltransferase)
MATVVRMPSVLAGAAEAVIAKWLVGIGDTVAVGDTVAEIETEKALAEYAAEEAGTVGRLVLAEGEAGETGDPIMVLIAAGEGDAAIDAALGTLSAAPDAVLSRGVQGPAGHLPGSASGASRGAASASERSFERSGEPRGAPERSGGASPAQPDAAAGATEGGGSGGLVCTPRESRVFASPLVRKMAAEQGIDLRAIKGTGPNGRIVRRDLERLAKARAAAGTAEPAVSVADDAPVAGTGRAEPAGGTGRAEPAGGRLIPHTPMRRAIARRLSAAAAAVPHFSMATECVVDELLALRERVNATAAARVSVNDFVIMAAAGAYGDVPEANVTWSEQGLIASANVDISIAVATGGGLVTPVLRDVGAKRLSQVAREARDLAQRARDRRLMQHEIDGGVLSVSNLGMYGTLEFSAIINPPQSAILAVGAARQQPVAADGAVTVATVLRCTLSVDHRAIDGALAARWLAAFTARVESPLGAIA